MLRERAAQTPHRTALEFLGEDGASQVVTYDALDARARGVASILQERGVRGERALLLYPPGINYVVGFFGCLYAGVVAVPVYLPTSRRGRAAMLAVATDASATLALGDRASLAALGSMPECAATSGQLTTLATDEIPDDVADAWHGPGPQFTDLAFVQYTSGSVGIPKGVMVRHDNLAHNSAVISEAIGAGPESRSVSWLPPYHDMGLIGGILQPVYAGFPGALLAPSTFLRKPVRWLEAISRTGATMSVAPDFAYLECARRISSEESVGLDLKTWQHALVGAEPVRASTLDSFGRAFASAGFRRSAFRPCYGLAEATLLVTMSPLRERGPVVINADREQLERGRVTSAGIGSAAIPLTSCGRPHSDDLVVVVNEQSGQVCGPGAVGEVWVSGAGVTDGYWGRPDKTEQVFHADLPKHGERRFLRTGDLGCVHEDELYIVGRAKDLIVVRGRNHHPQDIEQTAERAHPGLRPSGAAAFGVDDGAVERVVLVHEVVSGFALREAIAAVRDAVVAEHGIALHEVVLVRRGTIPRTTSGKIRRSECRRRWLAGELARVVGPEPSVEKAEPGDDTDLAGLVGIVGAALGLPQAEVDPDTSLVGLGLDSLTGMRLATILGKWFSTDIGLERLLDGMTPRQLVRELLDTDATGNIGPTDGQVTAEPGELTSAQQWIWLLDQRMGDSGACTVVGGINLTGPVDAGAVRGSLNELVRQHRALRTTFPVDADGLPTVVVGRAWPIEFAELDLSGLSDPPGRTRQAIEDLATKPFAPAAGPLLRAVLVRLGPQSWCLVLCAHHLIVDGWSFGLLLRDLGTCYRALVERTQVPRFHRDSPTASVRGDLTAAEGFWREYLSGAQPVNLPLDNPMPANPTWRSAALPFELSAEQTAGLKAYGRTSDATLFMVLLAGLGAALARWTGQDDLVIGTPSAGRDPDTVESVGLFTNMLPFRVDAAGAPTFGELLRRVRASALAAYQHRQVPFGQILRQTSAIRSDGRAPLVRVALALQNVPLSPWQAGGVRAEPFELPSPGAQFELYLRLSEQPDGRLSGHVVYQAELFDATTVQALLEAVRLVLRTAPELPSTHLLDLPILPDDKRDRMLAELTAACSASPAPTSLVEAIERQADRLPASPALRSHRGILTYRHLDEEANRLAWLLRETGVGPERLVGVSLPTVPELAVAVLAGLKAGAAVTLTEQDGPVAVVTTMALAARYGATGRPVVVCLDAAPQVDQPSIRLDPGVSARSLATVTDSGLMLEQADVARRVAAFSTLCPLTDQDVVLVEPSVPALVWCLGSGAEVVLDKRPSTAGDLLAEHGVTTWLADPEALRAFVNAPPTGLGSLRRVLCLGQQPPEVLAELRAILPDARVLLAESAGFPAGRRVVLDKDGRLVPIGAVGEIHISGPRSARGYRGRAGYTAGRFVPDPFLPGGRSYRTGERGRWRADGTVETLAPPNTTARIRQSAFVAPRDVIERRLAEIWCEILGIPEVSVTSDFSEVGGHSLVATRIVVRLRAEFGVELPLACLLGGKLTIERLADQVRRVQLEQASEEDLAALLASLAKVPDEQIATLLAEESAGGDHASP
ncbi:AMP-binding protein [Streptomyces anulatus]|uniref:AMP-binding protein n=1 Tax=Streptomyces anulatus TaxID=1892 RepID=UPI0036B5FF19